MLNSFKNRLSLKRHKPKDKNVTNVLTVVKDNLDVSSRKAISNNITIMVFPSL